MSQSNIIVGAIFIAFVVFVTVRGRLPLYMQAFGLGGGTSTDTAKGTTATSSGVSSVISGGASVVSGASSLFSAASGGGNLLADLGTGGLY